MFPPEAKYMPEAEYMPDDNVGFAEYNHYRTSQRSDHSEPGDNALCPMPTKQATVSGGRPPQHEERRVDPSYGRQSPAETASRLEQLYTEYCREYNKVQASEHTGVAVHGTQSDSGGANKNAARPQRKDNSGGDYTTNFFAADRALQHQAKNAAAAWGAKGPAREQLLAGVREPSPSSNDWWHFGPHAHHYHHYIPHQQQHAQADYMAAAAWAHQQQQYMMGHFDRGGKIWGGEPVVGKTSKGGKQVDGVKGGPWAQQKKGPYGTHNAGPGGHFVLPPGAKGVASKGKGREGVELAFEEWEAGATSVMVKNLPNRADGISVLNYLFANFAVGYIIYVYPLHLRGPSGPAVVL